MAEKKGKENKDKYTWNKGDIQIERKGKKVPKK